MDVLKESVHFYSRHVESLLLLAFSILLPFLIIHMMVTNYIYNVYQGTIFIFYGDLSNAFLMLLIMVVTQVPFIRFVWSDMEGEERKLASAYVTFFEYGISLFLFAAIYVLAVAMGSMLLIIPGFVILVLFFLTPYVVVVKRKPASKSWREALRLGKQKFLPLLCIILMISFVEWLTGYAFVIGVSQITTNYGAIVGSQMLVSILCFPFLVIYITFTFRKWQGQSIEV